MLYGDVISILRGIPLFCRLEPAKLKLLAFSSAYLTCEPGEALFHEGEPADAAFVIRSGEVEVVSGKPGDEVVLGTLGKNDLFGEMALILNEPRSATIRAVGPLEVVKIDADVFLRLVTENPETALAVMRSLSEKIVRLTERYNRLQHRLQDPEPTGEP